MKKTYILSIDCGTTGNRAIVFDKKQNIVANSYSEFTQYYPKPGWVEHDALEIWNGVQKVIKSVLKKVPAAKIDSIGITNQRETIVLWNKKTGKPVHKAIVWQCRRTASICESLRKKGHESKIHKKTGLFLDPYFSGTKIQWLIEKYPAIKSGLKNGTILCGTIDTWIIWNLTRGTSYSTDPTNASRTLLYDIKTKSWDKTLCKLFKVPVSALPEVLPSSQVRGETKVSFIKESIPIAGVVGDQQSSAFAQGCSPKGVVKNTYGTGLFVVANVGKKPKYSKYLVTTMGAMDDYLLEGSIFIGGAAIQWLRDGLKTIHSAKDTERDFNSIKSNDGVYFVPALQGLGCPHWDANARGVIIGLTRQTTKEHLSRAAIESMAYQTCDVVELLKKEFRLPIKELRVDGGAVKNPYLMQFQSDILSCVVERPKVIETTALGAAGLAGIATKFWKSEKEFLSLRQADKKFRPKMSKKNKDVFYAKWKKAVDRSLSWE